MAKVALVVKKYDGDDMYSYAVFHKADIPKGQGSIVFYGDAKPLVSGCSKMEANHYKKQLSEKNG